jgi:hypothetical protein
LIFELNFGFFEGQSFSFVLFESAAQKVRRATRGGIHGCRRQKDEMEALARLHRGVLAEMP